MMDPMLYSGQQSNLYPNAMGNVDRGMLQSEITSGKPGMVKSGGGLKGYQFGKMGSQDMQGQSTQEPQPQAQQSQLKQSLHMQTETQYPVNRVQIRNEQMIQEKVGVPGKTDGSIISDRRNSYGQKMQDDLLIN